MTTSEVRWEYRPPRSFGFLIVSPISLAVSPTGEVAISTDGGRTLCFTSEGAMLAQWWDNDSPRHLALLNGDQIVGTDSFSLCRWKRTGRKMAKRRLDERAYGFAASANGEQVCLRSIHAVQVWDVVADFLLATYPVSYGGPVVTMSPDGRKVAFCGTSEITLCTVGGKAEILQAEGASVRSLRFATHGLDLVAGCSDGSIRHWHLD